MSFFNAPNRTHVKSITTTSPPGSPNTTDQYIVPSGASGAWSGQTNKFTRYNGSSWDFILPNINTLIWTEDTTALYIYNGTSWGLAGANAAGSGTINSGTSGNLAVYSGTTAIDDLAIGSANQILGVNNAASAHEYKTLVQGSNVTITHGANSVTIAASTGSSPPFTDTSSIIQGSADPSKQLRFEVDGLTASNIRVWTVPDFDLTVTGIASTQTLTNKTINASNNTLSNITEAMLSFSDITTLNATTGQHGFLRKLNGTASTYLDGSGNWSTPSGTGASLPAPDNIDLVANNSDPTKLLRFDLSGLSGSTTANLTIPNTASGTLVLTTFAQTLTNKTLTTPTIASFANATHDHSNAAGGGNLTPTALNLTDPNADRVLFWDDSAGVFAWLTMGTNLTITGTTLDASSGGGSGTPGGSGSELQFRGGSSTFSAVTGSSVTANGYITLAPSLVTTGSPSLLTITAPAHTTITASEFNDINWNLNRIVEYTGSTGFATQRVVRYQMPTLKFQNATGTISDAVGIELDSPKQGTNTVLTRSTALRVKPSATAHHGIWIDSPVSAAGDALAIGVSATKVMRVTHVAGNTNLVFGEGVSISNSSTDGFIYAPVFSGSTSPTGTPSTYNNTVPFYFQNNNIEGFKRLWAYIGSAWVNLTPFNMGGTNDPSSSAGSGAGTSPTLSVSGKNGFHEVTLTTGSSPSASAVVFTITFGTTSGSFAVTPYPSVTPSNANAAALTGTGQVYVSSRSTTSYSVSVGSTALSASTQYKFIVHCFS